ncbi:MAG TPA: relaxase/mobilization nuclease domain-containing protein [Chitinophagaceae bacterium]|nr:relaxase/mobilization nuclease domain-containing protein [Chitinophagaceae bacterium]
MVARINTGKSISKALNYNEKKVQHREAECLHAQNFLKDVNDMNFYEKRKTFEKLTTLNERTQTNMVHISLNFDPSERLSKEKLVEIARSYMEKIGFKDQPYIIYQHNDAGHPHIHIVTTNIRPDGSRISMHNMGRNESEVARKAIEMEFDLVKAESRKQENSQGLNPVNAQKIIHGKQTTKAAISNVLRVIIPQYKYSTLAELNAILKLYNIRADRCGEDTDTYKHQGLLFRVLDENDNPVGTPIKASLFYMKPTLNNLEKRFTENETLKQPHTKRIRAAIDFAFFRNSGVNMKELEKILIKEGISTVVRENKEGVIYGITYVDHKSKCVFNGSDLGKQYSARSIQERCRKQANQPVKTIINSIKKTNRTEIANTPRTASTTAHKPATFVKEPENSLFDSLLSQEKLNDAVPFQLRKTTKKRRRKKLSI